MLLERLEPRVSQTRFNLHSSRELLLEEESFPPRKLFFSSFATRARITDLPASFPLLMLRLRMALLAKKKFHLLEVWLV